MARRCTAVLLTVATLALSACGGDDEANPSGERSETTADQEEQPGTSGNSALSEDAGPEDGASEARAEDSPAAEPGAADTPSPASGAVSAETVNALELGTSLRDVLDRLGTKPVTRRSGPAGTTCYGFRVRVEKSDSAPDGSALRAELCFRDGKLRGTSLVSKPPPPD